MPRLGQNLESFFENCKRKMNKSSAYQLGVHIINIFEQIHSAGYVYNDLKLDNIMTEYGFKLPKKETAGNVFEKVSLHIVDFGFATKFVHCALDE